MLFKTTVQYLVAKKCFLFMTVMQDSVWSYSTNRRKVL